MPEVGVITEQGDLGLGYDVLNEEDQKTYAEATAAQSERDRGAEER